MSKFSLRFSFSSLLTLTLALTLFSCKSRGPKENKNNYKGLSKAEIIQRHQEAAPDFRTLSYKGKATADNPGTGSISFTYKMNILRDSLIWGSFSKLGIPGAMMLIDRDSIRARVTLNKTAFVCDYSLVSKMLGMQVDFDMLQALITGDARLTEDAQLVPAKDPPVEFRTKEGPYNASWFLSGEHFMLEKLVVSDPILGKESSVTYAAFDESTGQRMPMEIAIASSGPKAGGFSLKHTSVDINPSKTNFKFRIPKSYEIKPCALPKRP